MATRPFPDLVARCGIMALAALAALAVASGAAAQEAALRTEVDTTRITVGDRITLTVSVEHARGAAVVWPDSLDLSPFEVLASRTEPPETANGPTTSRAELDLTTFELGALEIPSFDVAVRSADGSEQTLSTDRFAIEVVSVGVDEGGDIRGIRGPLSIPMSALRIVLWLLLLLLAVGGAYVLGRRMRRGTPDEEAPVEPSRPPHEIALDALARLEASALLERGAIKEFHIEVSEILRRYVEARYRVAALEMTTFEVLDGLRRVGVGAEFRDGLRRFLDQCDMVKFAKVRPSAEASLGVLVLGRRLVESSVERRVAVEGGSVEGGSVQRGFAERRSVQGESVEARSVEGGSAEGQSVEGGSAEARSVQGASAEGGSVERGSVESSSAEGAAHTPGASVEQEMR